MRSVGALPELAGFGLMVMLALGSTSSPLPQKESKVTFGKDIAPIIFNHCSTCHRPGQVAPFPLLTYDDAKKRARLIALVTQSHSMPPWKPEPGYGDFLGVRRLSEEQVRKIERWAEDGAPEGDPGDIPLAPHFVDEWYLGKPDLVVKMPQPFTVPADGPDVYHCFVIPVNVPETRYVVAYEYRPSNPLVVHHAIVVEDAYGAASRLETQSGAGYPCFGGFGFPVAGYLGIWTPGAIPHPEPQGVAKALKKGAGLMVQVHFHPTGKVEKEQSTIGLYLAKEPPTKIPEDFALGSMAIDIPPGEKSYRVSDYAYLPSDMVVIGIIPHAHKLCRQIKAMATLPDGTQKPLLWIKDWDFNWQEQYRYVNPISLPRGTRIDAEWTYDNTAENPSNPSHPPQRVTWGEASTDEMAELHLEVIPQ
jgi:mono/diheme cytochrome c family protein